MRCDTYPFPSLLWTKRIVFRNGVMISHRSYLHISRLLDVLPERPVVAAFTATATDKVRRDIIERLRMREPHVVKTGYARDNLRFSIVKGVDKRAYLLEFLRSRRGESGIIYAATRKEVDQIHDHLSKAGFSVGKYHAGMTKRNARKVKMRFYLIGRKRWWRRTHLGWELTSRTCAMSSTTTCRKTSNRITKKPAVQDETGSRANAFCCFHRRTS